MQLVIVALAATLALASLAAIAHSHDHARPQVARVGAADAHYQAGDRPAPRGARVRYPGNKHGIVAKPGEADGYGGPLQLERPGTHIDDDDDTENDKFLGEDDDDDSKRGSSSDDKKPEMNHRPNAGAWHVKHFEKQDADRPVVDGGKHRDAVANTREHMDFEFDRNEHHDPRVIDADAEEARPQAHLYESGKQDPNRPSKGAYNPRRWTGRKHPEMN